MATLRWGAATHEGQLRTQNEDYHHAGEGLFVVADGMGGHLAGEVASEMAVARLDERLPAGRLGSRDDLGRAGIVIVIAEDRASAVAGRHPRPPKSRMGPRRRTGRSTTAASRRPWCSISPALQRERPC